MDAACVRASKWTKSQEGYRNDDNRATFMDTTVMCLTRCAPSPTTRQRQVGP